MLTPMLLPPIAVRLRSAARLLAIAAFDGTSPRPTAVKAVSRNFGNFACAQVVNSGELQHAMQQQKR
jgi:hypothetical protein